MKFISELFNKRLGWLMQAQKLNTQAVAQVEIPGATVKMAEGFDTFLKRSDTIRPIHIKKTNAKHIDLVSSTSTSSIKSIDTKEAPDLSVLSLQSLENRLEFEELRALREQHVRLYNMVLRG